MRVLVNLLSTTNYSGRHVMFGHLRNLAPWTVGEHEYVILFHQGNRHIHCELGQNVTWVQCPDQTMNWFGRSLWERFSLPKLLLEQRIDFIWTPSGTVSAALSLPQISYAMNPWALVPAVKYKGVEHIKAAMQRSGYSTAVKDAAMMLFLSDYMRQAYRQNSGLIEKSSEVVYCGLDDGLFTHAEQMRDVPRVAWQILSVSVMAPHKGVATLLTAVEQLINVYKLPAQLKLVGAWPDASYEQAMKDLTQSLGIADAVTFIGHVSVEDLYRCYAEATVFSLMSWCESFGIPAAEAQAFGTPVVSSNCCAIPEVCGDGGIYPEPGHVEATAQALAQLLTDKDEWQRRSDAACENSQRYRWETCSRPLLKMFDVI